MHGSVTSQEGYKLSCAVFWALVPSRNNQPSFWAAQGHGEYTLGPCMHSKSPLSSPSFSNSSFPTFLNMQFIFLGFGPFSQVHFLSKLFLSRSYILLLGTLLLHTHNTRVSLIFRRSWLTSLGHGNGWPQILAWAWIL
jgi:hypothetical protein